MAEKEDTKQAADRTEREPKPPGFSVAQMGATGVAIALLVLVILIVISMTGGR